MKSLISIASIVLSTLLISGCSDKAPVIIEKDTILSQVTKQAPDWYVNPGSGCGVGEAKQLNKAVAIAKVNAARSIKTRVDDTQKLSESDSGRITYSAKTQIRTDLVVSNAEVTDYFFKDDGTSIVVLVCLNED